MSIKHDKKHDAPADAGADPQPGPDAEKSLRRFWDVEYRFDDPEQEREFKETIGAMREELKPEGLTEELIFSHLAHSKWRMLRYGRLLARLVEAGHDYFGESTGDRQVRQMHRWIESAQRCFSRSIRQIHSGRQHKVQEQRALAKFAKQRERQAVAQVEPAAEPKQPAREQDAKQPRRSMTDSGEWIN